MIAIDVENILLSLFNLLQLFNIVWGLGVVIVILVDNDECVDEISQFSLNFSGVDVSTPEQLSCGA
jgi:hypothetical protein